MVHRHLQDLGVQTTLMDKVQIHPTGEGQEKWRTVGSSFRISLILLWGLDPWPLDPLGKYNDQPRGPPLYHFQT